MADPKSYTDRALRELAAGETEVEMRHCPLGFDEVWRLGKAVAAAPKLERLSLMHLDLTDGVATHLGCAAQRCKTLRSVNLRGNRLTDFGAWSFVGDPTPLTYLNLAMNEVTGDTFTRCLGRLAPLVDLYLYDNKIGDVGASDLALSVYVSETLYRIDLSRNRIGDSGIEALAAAAACCPSLRILKLDGNRIGDAGAAALAAIADKGLEVLGLGRNAIGAEGIGRLAATLTRAKGFEYLDLRRNPGPFDALADAVRRSTTLRWCGWDDADDRWSEDAPHESLVLARRVRVTRLALLALGGASTGAWGRFARKDGDRRITLRVAAFLVDADCVERDLAQVMAATGAGREAAWGALLWNEFNVEKAVAEAAAP